MSDYPKTMFRHGGPEIFHGRHYESCVVNDENEERQKVAANWLSRPLEEPEAEPVKVEDAPKAKPKAKSKAKKKGK
jgi:hypothetical protein